MEAKACTHYPYTGFAGHQCRQLQYSLWQAIQQHKTDNPQRRKLHLKSDGTRAKTRFRLSPKRTSPFKSAGRHFSPLLAAEVCVSAVVMLDTPCSEVVWRVLATHSIRQFPLHFPSRASRCAIRFQPQSTTPANSKSHLVLWQSDMNGNTGSA